MSTGAYKDGELWLLLKTQAIISYSSQLDCQIVTNETRQKRARESENVSVILLSLVSGSDFASTHFKLGVRPGSVWCPTAGSLSDSTLFVLVVLGDIYKCTR